MSRFVKNKDYFFYKLCDSCCVVDIDECTTHGACSQLCENFPGGFKCDCYPGYKKVDILTNKPKMAYSRDLLKMAIMDYQG